MAYCKNCGNQIDDRAVICPACGVPQEPMQGQQQPAAAQDNGGFGYGLLGFCIPIVGIILYFVWKNDKPKSSKAAGLGAVISIGIAVVFYIIYAIIMGAAIGSMYY